MKILVTGFDPFGGESINPAYEVVKRLRDNISGAEVVKLQIPTAFNESIKKTTNKIKEINPDFVLNIGQAGGRSGITVERVAININDARIPDNLNQQPVDTKIDETGENAYFASIPIKAIVQAIRDKKIPAAVSDSAGTYVCNHIMYGVQNYIHKNNLNIKAGFIHIPYLFQQVINKPNTSAMDIDTMVKAIETAIEVIITKDTDIKKPEGNIC
ncbi:MAG: pyroglutamyl-peptidase I [Methanobacterium paludis]|nr:pyroglutamyl-peptidase I [Methanobacterium paludis]